MADEAAASKEKVKKKVVKKKKAKQEAKPEAEKKKPIEAETKKDIWKPDPPPPKATEGEATGRREDHYSAAGVVFFTRTDAGAVDKVLVAVEERKVQASYIGMDQPGKIVKRMLMFPMGRRERKDKGDTVETAKREYLEETGDFGHLSRHLDFADFTGEDLDSIGGVKRTTATWTGRKNMAVYFTPASLIALFCEVPAKSSLSEKRVAVSGKHVEEDSKREEEFAAKSRAKAAELAESGPSRKKPKKERGEVKRGNPSYTPGRTDHLEPAWLQADDLRKAITSGQKAPAQDVRGEECRMFPTMISLLRTAEAREWLGLPKEAPKAEKKT